MKLEEQVDNYYVEYASDEQNYITVNLTGDWNMKVENAFLYDCEKMNVEVLIDNCIGQQKEHIILIYAIGDRVASVMSIPRSMWDQEWLCEIVSIYKGENGYSKEWDELGLDKEDDQE